MKIVKYTFLIFAVILLFTIAFFKSEGGITCYYNDISRNFAASEMLPLVFETRSDMFSGETYQKIKQLSDELKMVPGVSGVISISTAQILSGNGDDLTIMSITSENESELEETLAKFSDIYGELLYSKDRKTGLIILRLFNNVKESDYPLLMESTGKVVTKYTDDGLQVYRFGPPAVLTMLTKRTVQTALIFPIILLLFALFSRVVTKKSIWTPVFTGLLFYLTVINTILLFKLSIFLMFPAIVITVISLMLVCQARIVVLKPSLTYVSITIVLTLLPIVLVCCKSTTVYDIYKGESEYKKAALLMDSKLLGCMLMDVIVNAPAINSSGFLTEMDRMKSTLKSETGKIIILSDFIKMMNRAFFYGKQEFYEVPIFKDSYREMDFSDQEGVDLLITQYLFLYQGTLDEFAAPDLVAPEKVRCLLFLKGETTSSGHEMIGKSEKLANVMKKMFNSDVSRVKITGLSSLEKMINRYVTAAGIVISILLFLLVLFFNGRKEIYVYFFTLLAILTFIPNSIIVVSALLSGLLLAAACAMRNPIAAVLPGVLLFTGIPLFMWGALIALGGLVPVGVYYFMAKQHRV